MTCEDTGAIEPLNLASDVDLFEGMTRIEGGGVSSARGFRAAGVHAGFRADPERLDLALIVADEPAACAATFTQNVFCAAPVTVSREHLDGVSYGTARALVVNSGAANAATGSVGLDNARATARIVGDVVGCPANAVMVARRHRRSHQSCDIRVGYASCVRGAFCRWRSASGTRYHDDRHAS